MSAVASVSNATGTTAQATHAHHQARQGTPQKIANSPPQNAAATRSASVTKPASKQSSKANIVV